MIRYISHEEIDRSQWDALINEAPNGLIYALSWYLDIVSPGWAAFVKEAQGRYVAVLPLPERRKFGLRYLKQPLFAQQLGLFYLIAPTAADWHEIGRLLRRQFRFISHYAFNTGNTDLLGADQLGLDSQIAYTYYLALRPLYAQLLAGYRPNRRRQLSQGQQQHWQLEPATDLDLLLRIFAENTASKIYGLLGEVYEYPMVRALYFAARKVGMVSLWQARSSNGEVGAMMLLFRFKNQITYLFNASTTIGKEKRAISVLLDEVFRTYAGQDLCFDFEAHDTPGLVQFYSSFGSIAAPFLVITADRLPWPVRQLKAARVALYRRLRPRPAANGA